MRDPLHPHPFMKRRVIIGNNNPVVKGSYVSKPLMALTLSFPYSFRSVDAHIPGSAAGNSCVIMKVMPTGKRRWYALWRRLARPFSKGRSGERAAAWHLIDLGYTILERNWTCPIGEIDIVAREGDVLCIVEVKRRLSARKGRPEEALTDRKRRKLEQLAAVYLQRHPHAGGRIRLDFVAVDDTMKKREIRLYRGV
jgi:putative endonuclease